MPPPLLVDLKDIDLEQIEFGIDAIREHNPHRFELELLSGIVCYRPEESFIVGVYDVPQDAFWVRGHIPGRPLMPGVLMVECAAQLCSFYWRKTYPEKEGFFGFGGIENTRFRDTVAPGERIIVAGRIVQLRPRRAIFDTQGFISGRMIFSTRIMGMLI